MASYDPLAGTHGLASRRLRHPLVEEPPPPLPEPLPPVQVHRAPTADVITPDLRDRILAAGEIEERRLPARTAVVMLVGLTALLWVAFDQFAANGGHMLLRWPLPS